MCGNNILYFYIALFLSAVILLSLVNYQNHVASFRRAAMKVRLPISTIVTSTFNTALSISSD